MSTTLYELGRWCYRHHRRVGAIWLVLLIALGGLAALTAGPYRDDFRIPGSSSQAAMEQITATFPEAMAPSATAIVIMPEGVRVDSDEGRAIIQKVIDGAKANPQVESVASPFNEMVTGMISDDGRAALVQLTVHADENGMLTEGERDAMQADFRRIQSTLPEGTTLSLGGSVFNIEMPAMSIIEAIGVLVALVVLFITLGSLIAAGLPLLTALLGVGFGMIAITIATGIMLVNSTTPMLAVMLGLAVGIDYALFILSRHRDQLATGMDAEESAARSVATAGSAVVFAGLTVIIALVGLAIGGIPFLTAMGAFAAVTVAMAVVIALTALPALMGWLGTRMVPKAGRRASEATADDTPAGAPRKGGIFGWWVGVATKVPALTIALVVLVLGGLSLPAKDLQLALPNSGHHATTAPDRITYDLIGEHFGPGANGPLVVSVNLLTSDDPLGVMKRLKADIEQLPGVTGVPLATPNRNADSGVIQVVPATAPDDPRTGDVVNALRAQHDTWLRELGVDTAVTGNTAVQIDISDKLGKALLPFGIFVVGLSLVLLTMVFRSIAVPLKATIGYALSVGAAFGATNLVFNRGIGAAVINLDRPAPVISFLPIIVMGILFGLAMDYEVFLVSRIREDHVHGVPAREAVHTGFIGSGKVVTAAAIIMFAVFAFFVPEGMGPIKQIGFALAVGVAFDAFLVRMTLVPAVLAMLGEKAWWLPRWLDRLLPSFDVEGEALNRQFQLDGWPTPDHTEALHVEGFAVSPLFAPVDAHLEPGEIGAVVGETRERSALLLALTGRLAVDAGRGRVAGELLPDQASRVRRRSRWIDAPDTDLPAALEAVRDERLVVIDGADAIAAPRDQAALEAFIERVRTERTTALVLGFGNAEDASHWPCDGIVEVSPPRTTATPAPAAVAGGQS